MKREYEWNTMRNWMEYDEIEMEYGWDRNGIWMRNWMEYDGNTSQFNYFISNLFETK